MKVSQILYHTYLGNLYCVENAEYVFYFIFTGDGVKELHIDDAGWTGLEEFVEEEAVRLEACKALVEYIKNTHPTYTSVFRTEENIKLSEMWKIPDEA